MNTTKDQNIALMVLHSSIALEGMKAANYERQINKQSLAYPEEAFIKLQHDLNKDLISYQRKLRESRR